MGQTDFNKPLVLDTCYFQEVQTQRGVERKEVGRQVAIEWKSIVWVEEFAYAENFHEFDTKGCPALYTDFGQFIAYGRKFDEFVAEWTEFKSQQKKFYLPAQ